MSCCKDENMTCGEGGCESCGNCGGRECAHGATVMPVVGKEVPDMTLHAYHEDKEKEINLSDYRGGWLILFFYPKDFTFVCPTELEDMAEHYERFKKEGAEVVSVSTDTVPVHKAWHDTSEAVGKVTFPMAADPTHALTHALGVHIEEEGVALRGSFIVDPNGQIVSMEVNADAIGRNASELLRRLQAAKFAHEHGGNVCPANWKPGDDTLKPGLDLVGKI